MAVNTRTRCRVCGEHERDAGPISWTGKCGDCGVKVMTENVVQMYAHSGPNWTKWRRAMAASVGGRLIDDVRESA
jgi:hypothetical protein